MNQWTSNVWHAIRSLGVQLGIALDDLLNVVGCGLLAILMAILTGARQDIAYADETLSAHAYRADERGRWLGRILRPAIDFGWRLQKPDPRVDAAVSKLRGYPVSITSHCERAFWKKKLHLYSPVEYREGGHVER